MINGKIFINRLGMIMIKKEELNTHINILKKKISPQISLIRSQNNRISSL